MQDTEEPVEQSTAKSEERDSTEPEKEHSDSTLYYAFIYSTIFLLALFVAVQFEPLIGYRYPVLLLVATVILLFTGTSHKELKQKRAPQLKKQSLFITLFIMVATSTILVMMVIPESPVLFLLIPLALAILILESYRARCRLHNDST